MTIPATMQGTVSFSDDDLDVEFCVHMQVLMEHVEAFHQATDSYTSVTKNTIPLEDVKKLREFLIREEYNELKSGILNNDIVQIADGCADLIYVVLGTALAYGIDLAAVWEQVHRSNMAKIDPATGKVKKREDGKILKPDGWQPPDIHKALGIKRDGD